MMRAKLSVGIPNVISADYISIVQLEKPNHILTRSEENTFLRFLESEWHFDLIYNRNRKEDQNRTLVKFRVEFEMYSPLTANLVGLVFDDFTHKTMKAFLERSELLNQRKK